MTKREIVTLIGVISKVKELADTEYNGKIYDNILAIFNRLHTKEKRVLLKGLINICFVVEDKILVSTDDLIQVKEAITSTKCVVENAYTVEQTNKHDIAMEIVKIKKILALALIIFLSIVLLSLVLFSFGSHSGVADIVVGFFDLASKFF